MKRKILPFALFVLMITVSLQLSAQSKKFFAVTGEDYGNINWIVFKQMDLSGNAAPKTIYVPDANNENVLDAVTSQPVLNAASASAVPTPTSTPQTCGCINNRMVAAIAFDAVDNRLYYTNMAGNQLRYLDLNGNKPQSYAVTTQLLKSFSNQPGEASVITRMCFGADGFGYALTNDGEHLIRFSASKQTNISDLGSLIDAKTNGENSVKKQFQNWGGDMVADVNGNLYLFTIQHSVFKINPSTRVAAYLGDVKGLPADYTINAAMVEENASVIVASSSNTDSYYRVDLTTLQATSADANNAKVYNASDFANGNFAFGKKPNVQNAVAKTLDKSSVTIYPNPVTAHNFTMQFSNYANDKYSIKITDINGKVILKNETDIFGSQNANINLPQALSAGTYLLKVYNSKNKEVYNNKIIVN